MNANPNYPNKNKKLSNKERELYNEISGLVNIPDVMRILDSSIFFVKEYLQQEFKQSLRFKIDKIHPSGVPLKESHEKRLKKNEKNFVKFSSYNKPNLEIQLTEFKEQKPKLRYFTMGSRKHPNQFERWSPEEMYNWWYKLRISGIPKSEWKILDAVFFLFINQISCICNSYIRYGIKNISNNKNVFKEELKLLSEYFRLLDEFYNSGGEYGLLIDIHGYFCDWFEKRISYDPINIYVEYENNNNIIKLFNNLKNNKIIHRKYKSGIFKHAFSMLRNHINSTIEQYSLVLFTSFFQKPSDFISLYSIPVLTIIGIPNKSHNGMYYSPSTQIAHDFWAHSDCLIQYYNHIYSKKTLNDIKLFEKKMKFLQLLSVNQNNDAKLLLWAILHESQSFYILFIDKYLKNNSKSIFKQINYDRSLFCNNFFEIEILLEQLLRFKSVLEKIIELKKISENEEKILHRIIINVDILIETCKETLIVNNTNRIYKIYNTYNTYNPYNSNNNNNNN